MPVRGSLSERSKAEWNRKEHDVAGRITPADNEREVKHGEQTVYQKIEAEICPDSVFVLYGCGVVDGHFDLWLQSAHHQ